MSFPIEGYTLTLDFSLREGAFALIDSFDAIMHEGGGRIYLAKNARCMVERVREGYPRRAAFHAVRAEAAGSAPRFTSKFS